MILMYLVYLAHKEPWQMLRHWKRPLEPKLLFKHLEPIIITFRLLKLVMINSLTIHPQKKTNERGAVDTDAYGSGDHGAMVHPRCWKRKPNNNLSQVPAGSLVSD